MTSPKFSIVIPTVKQTLMVRDCVASLFEHERDRSRYEVIVVEDGSEKEIQDWLRTWADEVGVTLIAKEQNSGFAHTVNVGMRHATGDVLLLLNNDVTFIGPVLAQIEAAFRRDTKVGIVGCKLLYPNMTVQHAGVVRRPGSTAFAHIAAGRRRDDREANRDRYCISVTGALFAISRAAYQAIGPFNENYFLSCEDTEYCLRAWGSGYRVWYAHQAEAVHHEGGTRGSDDKSKARIHKGVWYMKERETWAKFAADFPRLGVEAHEATVARLNALPPSAAASAPKPGGVRLEIGSGYAPQPGYVHLDVRPDLPQIDVVCDFSRERLPFDNGKVAELVSNHVIEHVSWRKLPFVLSEWHRVLEPGGRLFFRTPDLEFICRTYLARKTTPEWPGDEDFVRKHLAAEVTPAWWANIKLFAGQDYPSNFHNFCLDFDTAKALLERYGFERVARVDVKPVFSPGELQVEAYKQAASVSTVTTRGQRALICRKGAMGDVLLTTPVARRLREELGPDAVINVATDCGSVYQNNPHVDAVFPSTHPRGGYDRVVDLNLAYEREPQQHVIDAYSKVAFGAAGDYDKSTVLSPSPLDVEAVERRIAEAGFNPRRTVVLHMAQTWKNRTWPAELWRQTVDRLLAADLTVVQVGSAADFRFTSALPGLVDWINALSLHQIAALCSRVAVFCGNDSGLLHVAGTTGVKIVGLFTSALGAYRVPWREGRYGAGVTVVEPPIDCKGCLHREPPPVVYCDCRRGDFACLALMRPETVAAAVVEAAG